MSVSLSMDQHMWGKILPAKTSLYTAPEKEEVALDNILFALQDCTFESDRGALLVHICCLALIQKQSSLDVLSLPCDVRQNAVAGGHPEICFKSKSEVMELKQNVSLAKTMLQDLGGKADKVNPSCSLWENQYRQGF